MTRSSGRATAVARGTKTIVAETRIVNGKGITTSSTSSCDAKKRPNGVKVTARTGPRKTNTTAIHTARRQATNSVKMTEKTWATEKNGFVTR